MRYHCAQAGLRIRRGNDEHDTVMEVYEGVLDVAAFKAHLHDTLMRSEFQPLAALSRHEEWFDDVPDCI